jgi:uncharacterized protein (TIGR00290 family)
MRDRRAVVSWSGGKDACLALREVQARGYRVEALLTTVTEGFERVSIHGVRRALLRRQAGALGLPLHEVFLPQNATNAGYEARLAEALSGYSERGIPSVVFGDLFLRDIRQYRERLLADLGMRGLFPLWGRDTRALIRDFVGQGFEAVVVCADAAILDASWAGRRIDESFLADLPAGVDSCGENGEFHTFVYGGPGFEEALHFETGEVVLRDGRYFRDLLPL